MRKERVFYRIYQRVISLALALILGFAFKSYSFAEESDDVLLNSNVIVYITQDLSKSVDGNKLNLSAIVYNDAGEAIDVADGNVTIYYNKSIDGKYNVFNSKFLSVSKNKEYQIYAEFNGNDKYLPSKSEVKTISVKQFVELKGNIISTATVPEGATGTITVGDSYADFALITALTYYKGNSGDTTVEGITISGLSEGTYYVSVPAKSVGDTFYLKSKNEAVKIEEGAQPVIYKISVTEDENLNWTHTYFEAQEGTGRTYSTKVTAKNSDEYYISDVVAEPASNASVSYYASTGEVSISNITGDVSIKAVYEKKEKPASLSLDFVSPNENGIYSENNPAIQFSVGVSVKDDDGNAVPDTTVYFKSDKNEISYSSAKTDSKGEAIFKQTYSIVSGKDSADYEGLVSLSKDFEGAKSYPVHLIKQKKSDLVLYEDQIFGTYPNEKNGKVVNVPDGYEIWTGTTHQGAYVAGTGSWEKAVNGEFTGLDAGQHLIRAGEKYIAETGTFYFASNQADFFVPRALWTLTIDKEKSENVIFEGDPVQYIEPGQNVYIPVKAIDGYEISEIVFSKPGYISGEPIYYAENGYYKIDAISGTVTAYVIAVKSENNAIDNNDNVNKENDNTENETTVNEKDPDQKNTEGTDKDITNSDIKQNDQSSDQNKEENTDQNNGRIPDNINGNEGSQAITETNNDGNSENATGTETDSYTNTSTDTNTNIEAETGTETDTNNNNNTDSNNDTAPVNNAVFNPINDQVANNTADVLTNINAAVNNAAPEADQNNEDAAEGENAEVLPADNTAASETIEATEAALAGGISGSDIADLSAEEPVKSGISAAKIILISTAFSLLAAAIIAASIIYLKRKKEKEL